MRRSLFDACQGAGLTDFGSVNTMATGDTFAIVFDQTNGFDQIGAPTGS